MTRGTSSKLASARVYLPQEKPRVPYPGLLFGFASLLLEGCYEQIGVVGRFDDVLRLRLRANWAFTGAREPFGRYSRLNLPTTPICS